MCCLKSHRAMFWGPLLFVIFKNDIGKGVKETDIKKFDDDISWAGKQ